MFFVNCGEHLEGGTGETSTEPEASLLTVQFFLTGSQKVNVSFNEVTDVEITTSQQ